MKFTLSWLKEHLDTDADAATIGERLTSIGLEVESITDPGAALKDFVVGEVVTAERHPNADKLRQCVVETKDGVKRTVRVRYAKKKRGDTSPKRRCCCSRGNRTASDSSATP
mgnify:CR=1 FL=1